MKCYFLCILMVTQLMACTSVDSLKKVEPHIEPSVNIENILAIKDWQLLGRLSVLSPKESWLAILKWRHDELIDNLTLSTSIGGVIAKLQYSEGTVILTDADNGVRKVSEAELKELLGYAPPLSHLKFWVRGVVDPQWAVQVSADSNTQVMAFKQNGWLVTLSKFQQEGGLLLPKKVFIRKEGVKIKLVIDKWLM